MLKKVVGPKIELMPSTPKVGVTQCDTLAGKAKRFLRVPSISTKGLPVITAGTNFQVRLRVECFDMTQYESWQDDAGL